MRIIGIAALVAVMGGCSGQYIITIPDQVAPAGGRAAAVIRVQQYEFGALKRIIEDAPMRFSINGLAEKGAFTDELGYAPASVPVPDKPGKYELLVQMQNAMGDEASGKAPVYVWAKDSSIVAVDADSLPTSDSVALARARKALSKIAAGSHILYLTRHHPEDVYLVRAALSEGDYPDGPVLVWRRSYRHLVRTGRLRMPWIVNEAHLVCDLSLMREVFSGLKTGISTSPAAVAAFARAKMTAYIVGDAPAPDTPTARRASWSRLATSDLKP